MTLTVGVLDIYIQCELPAGKILRGPLCSGSSLCLEIPQRQELVRGQLFLFHLVLVKVSWRWRGGRKEKKAGADFLPQHLE